MYLSSFQLVFLEIVIILAGGFVAYKGIKAFRINRHLLKNGVKTTGYYQGNHIIRYHTADGMEHQMWFSHTDDLELGQALPILYAIDGKQNIIALPAFAQVLVGPPWYLWSMSCTLVVLSIALFLSHNVLVVLLVVPLLFISSLIIDPIVRRSQLSLDAKETIGHQ